MGGVGQGDFIDGIAVGDAVRARCRIDALWQNAEFVGLLCGMIDPARFVGVMRQNALGQTRRRKYFL